MSFALELALGLLLATAPVAGSAQAVTDIRIGQTLSKKVGTKSDIYRFVGASGTTIKATLTAPGKAALILYTPAGEEMLTAQGNGTVTLEAILPLNDVFLLAVLRKDGAQPYKLALPGVEADLHLAKFAAYVGYSINTEEGEKNSHIVTQCWMDPGVKLRITSPNSVQEIAIGRNGKEYRSWRQADGQSGTTEKSVRFENSTMVSTSSDGKESRRPLDQMWKLYPNANYKSYHCSP